MVLLKIIKVNLITNCILIIQLTQIVGFIKCDFNNDLLFQQLETTTPLSSLLINNNNYRSHQTNGNPNSNSQKLKYLDVWHEINEPIILNCSLRVNRDQHVVWHRKYDKLGVHVLTIGSETFISDLRIRPIKQEFIKSVANKNLNELDFRSSPNTIDTYDSQINYHDAKYTWNLEIRRLKREDSALYYCVLNSENAYGQIYKLNVLPQLKILNKSEILFDYHQSKHKPVVLVCKYAEIITNPNEHIKWFFNKIRIKNNNNNHAGDTAKYQPIPNTSLVLKKHEESNSTVHPNSYNHYSIIQTISYEKNESISTLIIHNFNLKHHAGRYKCQYKGLVKTVKLNPFSKYENTSNHLVYKQSSVYSISQISSSSKLICSYLLEKFSFIVFNFFIYWFYH